MKINSKHIFNRRLLTIFLHLIAWTIFIFYPFIFFQIRVFEKEFYYKQIINAAFLAGVFYFSTYYLFPRLVKRKKMTKHILLIVLIVILIPLQQYMLEYFFFFGNKDRLLVISPLSKVKIAEFHSLSSRKEVRVLITHHDSIPPGEMGDMPFISHRLFIPETLQQSFSSVLFVLLVSGFVSVAGELLKAEKQKKELENQRLNAELAFLKSQVNPHFFFNTLNTIYLLAHKKSDLTEQVVVKLSEIMRYMIYESNGTEVSLSREIKYLHDYIDLQQLRLSKKVDVQFTVQGDAGNLLIAPMLLIPFVENTFKHGVSYLRKSFIHIEIYIEKETITFRTINSLFERKDELEKSAGVGLTNVKKRLALLYPEKYTLQIDKENDEFRTNLLIQLTK